MTPLPRLMVAPNGARRGKADHPNLPITDDELIATALACHQAGADGIHIHIRDTAGRHLLDAERYRALLDRMRAAVPDVYVQVTSEAGGRYDAEAQRTMVRRLQARHISVGLREMVRAPGDWAEAGRFYHWAAGAGIEIQHILYAPDEVAHFVAACRNGRIPGDRHLVLFVLGSYADGGRDSADLDAYLRPLERLVAEVDWMVCAFGANETARLVRAVALGGKARVGFENSLWHQDGSVADDNAARVREVAAAMRARDPRSAV